MEIKQLSHKSMLKLERERLEKIEKKNYYNQDNLSQLKVGNESNSAINNKKINFSSSISSTIKNKNNYNLNTNKSNNRPPTPESIKYEIYKINEENKKKIIKD